VPGTPAQLRLPRLLLTAALVAPLPAAPAAAGPVLDVCGDGAPTGFEECDDGNTADGDGCDARCCAEEAAFPQILDSCARALATGFARVVAAEAKSAASCTRAIQRGRAPQDLPGCLAADASGRVGRAAARTAAKGVSCSPAETTPGVTDPATVNPAAIAAVDDAAADLVDALVLRSADRSGARCQLAAMQGLAKLEKAAAKQLARERLRWAGTPVRSCLLPDLAAASAAAIAGAKVERIALRLAAKLGRRCPTGDLAAWFGGAAVDASSSAALAASAAARARCRVCLAAAESLVLALDCDAVDGGGDDGSCP
jgi:cysteine-rich repeat protein